MAHVHRDAIAHGQGGPVNGLEVEGETAHALGVKGDRKQLGNRLGQSRRRVGAGEPRSGLGDMRHRFEQGVEFGNLRQPGVFGQTHEDAAQQPDQRLGAFDVAAQPEEIVRGSARQVVAGPAQ